ncbi:PDZ domain-containing protein [Flavicella sediminum]|uniref:PDZ domain-containing protein n=1 Tax=Flavicella sediminum TaxID=2585141 RepID=UPI00111D5B3C|nr:PDZ domain-containing protein [Flavicella sediminum]
MKQMLLFIVVLISASMNSQGIFALKDDAKKQVIHFKNIHNLIIIPLRLNGVEGSYILDTGVHKNLIFKTKEDPIFQDTLRKKIYLNGFGVGETIEAVVVNNNIFEYKKIRGIRQQNYVLSDERLDFSAKFGTTINGIIGTEFFRDFVVKINYSSKTITVYNPKYYKQKKGKRYQTLPLQFKKNKPYVDARVSIEGPAVKGIPINLLIDTGGSDAVWLYDDKNYGLEAPDKNFRDFLGESISGYVYGKKGRVEQFSLGNFKFEKPVVSFLDSASTVIARKIKGRNGSLGGEVLSRFVIWFDYRKAQITLKKNHKFKKRFSYNMSGLDINYNGSILVSEVVPTDVEFGVQRNHVSLVEDTYQFVTKPSFIIANIREGSIGETAGLLRGDVLVSINNNPCYDMTHERIYSIFHNYKDRNIKLEVYRQGENHTFKFKLKDEL